MFNSFHFPSSAQWVIQSNWKKYPWKNLSFLLSLIWNQCSLCIWVIDSRYCFPSSFALWYLVDLAITLRFGNAMEWWVGHNYSPSVFFLSMSYSDWLLNSLFKGRWKIGINPRIVAISTTCVSIFFFEYAEPSLGVIKEVCPNKNFTKDYSSM